ncbi:MAG TPA: hypothetical protein VMS35_06040 [Nitrososphaeraceae archaeon]|nr:hypothetical protein [Nitrososphaeraceae archaeon]
MKITIHSFLFLTLLVASISLFTNINAELKPNVKISPTCGDTSGYGMQLNVNGFEPNSNVGWKLVHPETQSIPSFGYFSTNTTGGFSESEYIEGELEQGKYELQFFDDANNDGKADQGKKEFIVSMSTPCE